MNGSSSELSGLAVGEHRLTNFNSDMRRVGGFPFVAIVTHKGNSADSGHYIGWTRQPTEENGVPGEEDWWKFDGEPRGGCAARIIHTWC